MSIDLYTKINGKLVPSRASVFSFPGGERHIKFDDGDLLGDEYALVRGADANDYIALQMWASCVAVAGGHSSAIIPYLPGARSDRGFPRGSDFYADLINMANVDYLVYFDPHSEFMPSQLETDGRHPLVVRAWAVIHHVLGGWRPDFIIAPDAGAVVRANGVAHAIGVPLVKAQKKRDFATGKLSGFEFIDPIPETGHGLIVDDICDAGGTFLGVASASGLSRDRLSLYVSHGIFSGNGRQNQKLQEAFSSIYTTDSHHRFPIWPSTTVDGPEFPYHLIVRNILDVLEDYL